MYIFFFNLLSQFTIVQAGDLLYQREISNSFYLFSQVIFFLVHTFFVEAFKIWITAWLSVFKWSVSEEKKCGLISWKTKIPIVKTFDPIICKSLDIYQPI